MKRLLYLAVFVFVFQIIPFSACASGAKTGEMSDPAKNEPVTELAQTQPVPQQQTAQQPAAQQSTGYQSYADSSAPRNLPQVPNSDEQYYLFFEGWTAKLTGEGLHIPELYDVSTTLNMVLKVMQDNPDYRLLIEGFANPVSGVDSEKDELLRLSVLRAKEVESRFIRDGISPDRLITVGAGGISNPYDNSRLQQAKNRRAQMTIIKPEGNKTYLVKFERNFAALTSREFYIREQLAALEQLREVVNYIKENPNARVLVQGFEQPNEARRTPISKQRADEVGRLLRRELRREGVTSARFIMVASSNVKDSAAEVMILPPLTPTIP